MRLSRIAVVSIAVCLGVGSALVAVSPASADSLTVSNGFDTGAGSLNQAIADANASVGPDTITITFAGTITLTTPLPNINGDMTITSTSGTIVDGAGTPSGTRGLDHQFCGTTLSVSGVTLRDFPGEGILSTCGSLSVNNVTVLRSAGTGVRAYGGTVSIVGSTFTSNASLGVDVSGNLPGMTTTLTTVTATLNGGSGVRVDSTAIGTVATLSGITATGNGFSGIQLSSSPGVISLSNATATSNTANGIDIDANGAAGTSTVAVSSSVASSNGSLGVYAPSIVGGATLTITDTTASSNGGANLQFDIIDGTGTEVSLTRVTANSSVSGLGLSMDTENGAGVVILDSQFNDNFSIGGVLVANGGSTVTVTRTEFARNNLLNGSGGGGLNATLQDSATLALDDCSITDNHAQFGGGAFLSVVSGALTITGSTFSGNSVTGSPAWGGGLYLSGLGDSRASVLIANSTISDNLATAGGGLMFFGLASASGGFRILRSTISDNIGTQGAGGVEAVSWGWNANPALAGFSIDQSTISGNQADTAAGIVALNAQSNASPAEFEIVNSTVSGNTATTETGGVVISSIDATAFLTVAHSTITGNSTPGVEIFNNAHLESSHSVIAGNGAFDVLQPGSGPAMIVDWSLIQNPDPITLTAMTAGSGNIDGIDPLLGPLANNGGPTLTHAPLAGSPILDAGDPAISGAPATDQRGLARVYQVIDLGALETQALAATGIDASTPILTAGALGFGGILLLLVRRRWRAFGRR